MARPLSLTLVAVLVRRAIRRQLATALLQRRAERLPLTPPLQRRTERAPFTTPLQRRTERPPLTALHPIIHEVGTALTERDPVFILPQHMRGPATAMGGLHVATQRNMLSCVRQVIRMDGRATSL